MTNTCPLSVLWFANIFSPHSMGHIFTRLVVSLAAKSLTYFFFFVGAFNLLKKSLPNSWSWRFTPLSSPKSFIVLGLIFRSVINFELIFVCGVRKGSQLHSFAYRYEIVPAHFVEETIVSYWIFLTPFLKVRSLEVLTFCHAILLPHKVWVTNVIMCLRIQWVLQQSPLSETFVTRGTKHLKEMHSRSDKEKIEN